MDKYLSEKDFYKEIKKYKDKNIKLHYIYKDIDMIDDKYISEYPEKYFELISLNAANIKIKKQRYEYIYDKVCEYLDNEFNNKNICGFDNNKCLSVRNNGHCNESKNGCCYGRTRGLCKNFKDGKCTIKSLSCKLFTCRFLKKNKIKYTTDNIPPLKYFFTLKQKNIITYSIFKDKDEIINLLMK